MPTEKNTGIPYELFVQRVQQAVIDAQGLGGYKNVNVAHDVRLIDANGIERQFDLYWEFEYGGAIYRNVIECKDFVTKIPMEKVDALAGKLSTFPGIRGMIATSNGFQSGAIKQAEAKGIDVLIVRPENDNDWQTPDGIPVIRSIIGEIVALIPSQVIKFSPVFDKEWAQANGVSRVSYYCLPKEIEMSTDANKSWTLQDDMEKEEGEDVADGLKHIVRRFQAPAYLSVPQNPRVRISGYELIYKKASSIKTKMEIKPEVLGVVEYVSRHLKKVVMKVGQQTVVCDEMFPNK